MVRQRMGQRPIVLVGLMGAGKTSVGRRLAEKLSIPFVDADHEIEAAAGKSIKEIFADHGEPYFREGERRVIQRLIGNGAQVLATGGGAYMNDETRQRFQESGISVWLRAALPILMKRVMKRQDRPLLQNENPEAVMRGLIETRYPVYALADVTVDSRDVQHGQMVNDVIRALAQWDGWDEKKTEHE
ncbi:MAG: shikimate kinase [Aestuariivirga sp.]|uniref:shikimate kinase n=1 Tax=Aestuariivirga sp. TaxID=2650926 RepID=UPI0030160B25